MVEKPTIIITSLGRTATTFFSLLFQEIVTGSLALHEPDFLTLNPNVKRIDRFAHVAKQISDGGIHATVLYKLLGYKSLRHVSDARFTGRVSADVARQEIIKRRRRIINRPSNAYYIESSSAFYGLLDVLPGAFRNHRAVYVVRDGRDWVRSWLNLGGASMYDRRYVRALISPDWPSAPDIHEDGYSDNWSRMSEFEKMCWAWSRLNHYAITMAKQNPYAQVYKFEDLFKSPEKLSNLETLVRFVTEPIESEDVSIEKIEKYIDTKVHQSKKGNLPRWPKWSSERKAKFMSICGEAMTELGYEV